MRRPAVSRQLVRFNSQPPEGGWLLLAENRVLLPAFQLTAARRRLGLKAGKPYKVEVFQLTAARRRLATTICQISARNQFQLTAARRRLVPPLKPLARKACIALFR